MKKYSVYLIVITLLVLSVSCNKNKSDKTYENLLSLLNNNPTVGQYEDFMYYCTREGNRPEEAVRVYEENSDLKNSVMANIYYATSLSLMADRSKKVTDQIKYVRASMNEFDSLSERYPDNARVFMWMAITYSNYPEVLGANSLCTDAINRALEIYRKDNTSLVRDELKQLVLAYFNIASTYKNKTYFEDGKNLMNEFNFTDDKECKDAENKVIKECKF